MLWRKAERCREYPARFRLVSNGRVFLVILLATCDTVLAACTAGWTTPASTDVARATDHGHSFGVAQQGELHLVLMPPDVLIGDLAEARR
jgi:hypothetical protein